MIKLMGDFINGKYYNNLRIGEKKEKWNLLISWIKGGHLDDELFSLYSNIRVEKLETLPSITNMLELSLHLNRLFHYNELKNKQLFLGGVCFYDAIFDNLCLDVEMSIKGNHYQKR
ncbi:MAG: hypothetical protein PHS81_01270 [Candidatus Nanoarchaeia archaeon]|nr:hypothetical protein [Candidatus Nanoarchaeia archaeon]